MTQAAKSLQTTQTVEQNQETNLSLSPALRARHIPLAMTFDELLFDADKSDETAEDIIQAIREWRDAATQRDLD